jgi:hypothetical protein
MRDKMETEMQTQDQGLEFIAELVCKKRLTRDNLPESITQEDALEIVGDILFQGDNSYKSREALEILKEHYQDAIENRYSAQLQALNGNCL